MSTTQQTETTRADVRSLRLATYRQRADPAIALISAFYLLLLLIPRVAITSYESSMAIFALDIIFWAIIVGDVCYRLLLTSNRAQRIPLILSLILLLTGLFVLRSISENARFLVRIAVISVVALRASSSVRYFFRLRSIAYITGAVIIITMAFGVVVTVVERDAPGAKITSLGIGIWWAIETISTVGYGDTFPVTNPGKIAATGLIFFGVAMFSILTATLANAFANRTESDAQRQLDNINDRLKRIEHNQQAATPMRRQRAPQRPTRRTPPPQIGAAAPPDEGVTTA